jgi:hypothetical protein
VLTSNTFGRYIRCSVTDNPSAQVSTCPLKARQPAMPAISAYVRFALGADIDLRMILGGLRRQLPQGDSSSRTLPLVSIANSSVTSPPTSVTAENAAKT